MQCKIKLFTFQGVNSEASADCNEQNKTSFTIFNGIFFEGDQGKFEISKKSSATMQTSTYLHFAAKKSKGALKAMNELEKQEIFRC